MNQPLDTLSRLQAALVLGVRSEVHKLLETELAGPLAPTTSRDVALLLSSHGRNVESLPYFQIAIAGASPEIDPELWRIAERVVKKSTRSSRKRDEFWRGCNSVIEVAFDEAREHILEGSADRAILALNSHLTLLYSPSRTNDLFRCLHQLARVGEPRETEWGKSERRATRPNPIFVAGTGWSGSGAVYDYLSEFDGVLAVEGEVPAFSVSSHSLFRLHQSITGESDIEPALVGFFFENLLGFSLIRRPRDLKAFEYARSKSNAADSARHWAFARKFCDLAAALVQSESKPERLQLFALLVDEYIFSLAPETDSTNHHRILFDNVIPLRRLRAFPMMELGTLIGSVRDARSIYADRRLSDLMFSDSLARFIGRQFFSRLALLYELRRFAWKRQGKQAVFVVQFEEFVVSDSLRKQLADGLALASQRHNANSHFHPAESEKNIKLHMAHLSPMENWIIRVVLWSNCVSIKETRCSKPVRPNCRLPGQLRPGTKIDD